MSRARAAVLGAWFSAAMLTSMLALGEGAVNDPWIARHSIARQAPRPEPDHPGNIYVLGEDVAVRIPTIMDATVVRWRALDAERKVIAEGELAAAADRIDLDVLGIGWYQVEWLDETGAVIRWTSAAVLAPLAVPTPQDSPVCLDTALSWHKAEHPEDLARMIRLAALAGVNWQRDRIHWREIETAPGEFAPHTEYDDFARMQADEGLKVLQVFHRTPPWAAADLPDTGHCPTDLGCVYAFCKAVAARFADTVPAWEPWNEGNAHNFGGHTIDELCALQKAAYLGFKAGAPPITVCWNPLGGINTKTLCQGILENETWPYYDVYSIHSYDWPHDYARLWEPMRNAAAGRPVWVTECDRGMAADPDSPSGDFTHAYALRKAELIAQEYASSLFAGAQCHFHFILGQYMEGENRIQFGLLRPDLTPRPSYVALAALGRFLAGARCLGRCRIDDAPDTCVYVFRSRPDGIERDVLVAWAESKADWPRRGTARAPWPLSQDVRVEAVFDYLGRSLDAPPAELRPRAVFVLLEAGVADALDLEPPAKSPYREGHPSPVVLQVQTAALDTEMRKAAWTEEQEHVATPGRDAEVEVVAYNFSGSRATGSVRLEQGQEDWGFEPTRWPVEIESMGHISTLVRFCMPENGEGATEWIRFRGDFGPWGEPVAAFRVLPRTPAE